MEPFRFVYGTLGFHETRFGKRYTLSRNRHVKHAARSKEFF